MSGPLPRRGTDGDADGSPACLAAAVGSDGALLWASEAWRRLGARPGQPIEAASALDDAGRAALAGAVRLALAAGQTSSVEVTTAEGDRPGRLLRIDISPERDADGRITGALLIGRDASAGPSKHGATQQADRSFRSLAENAGDTILRWNPLAVTLYVNPALDRLYQGRGHELIGRTPSQAARRNPEAMRALEDCVLQVASTGQPAMFELPLREPQSGQRLVHQLRLVPEFDAAGRVVCVLGIGRDVTGTVQQIEQIASLLHLDPLTQLGNRRALDERGAAMLGAARRLGSRVGLLLLDLDGFKAVNDELGHGAGDRLLQAIGQHLRHCARSQDLLVRLGGDEFVLLVPDAPDRDGLQALARRLHDAVAAPLQPSERGPRITASIGVALFPDDAADLGLLLAHADAAMYEAKRAGAGRTAGCGTPGDPQATP